MMLILNCDFDENPETNGGQLLRRQLAQLGARNILIKNVFQEELPSESELKTTEGIIITGSRASVYEKHNWIPELAKTLKKINALKIPTLAICFGFQIVAQTFGGQVEKSGTFWEGFMPIKVNNTHQLFENFPAQVKVYHSHGDVAKTLPKDAKILATAPHAIQAFELKNFWCVQFHPEITPQVAITMAERDGKDTEKILNRVKINYELPLLVIKNFLYSCHLNAQ
ncbi:MAG: type 1 glutamine amidotransferase [Candidatus Aenigmarchaeota archaeon]|nr:type 1 glutamine amidotransferase [Candidatus Aenigmarchaeota archaeon]